MNYDELVVVKDRILRDEGDKLYRQETNVRLVKALGWLYAVEDGDGVAVTEFLDGGGRRTIFFDNCTVDTLLTIPGNIPTLAAATKNYCGSIDDARHLIMMVTRHTCSIEMSEDPSGAGCTLRWWPYGIAEGHEFKASCVHGEIQLAMLWCFLEVTLRHQWFRKLPDDKSEEETIYEEV